MSYEITCLVEAGAQVGESPVWDAARNRLFWVDITGQRLSVIDLASRTQRHWDMPTPIGCLGLYQDDRVVVGLKHGVHVFDLASATLTLVAAVEADKPGNRINDGKIGPDGAFWVGTMDDEFVPKRPLAALYRVTADGKAEQKLDGLKVSNGLAWSADGRRMFHSDSRGPWIESHDFDPATGTLSNRQRLRDLTEAEGRPDGAACDVSGAYWSAGVSAGCLNRFSATGELLEKIPVPVPGPTMPCFGGPDMKTLFFTSLRAGLSEDALAAAPLSGGIFMMRVPVAGVPVARFAESLSGSSNQTGR